MFWQRTMFCGVAILFNGAPCGFLGEQEAAIKHKSSTKGHVMISATLSYLVVFIFCYYSVVLGWKKRIQHQKFLNIFIFFKSGQPGAWTRPPQSQILFRDSFRGGGSAGLDLPANSTLCQYSSTIGGVIFLRECNFRGNGPDLYSPIGDLPRAPEADLASKPPELCTQRFITEGASRVSH